MNFRYIIRGVGIVLIALALWALIWPRAELHFWGIDTQQSDNYDFFSGVGPMVITLLLGSGVFVTVWSYLNCHVDGCPRVGRFSLAGGHFKVCRIHHREVTGHPHKLTAELIKAEHALHLSRMRGSGESARPVE